VTLQTATARRIYVAGVGIVSPLGHGLAETIESIRKNRTGLRPLTLFATGKNRGGPVGEIQGRLENPSIPRTHQLACIAAEQAMARCRYSPDAVVLGTTTGGMAATEEYLKIKERDSTYYRYHSLGSVAEVVASRVRCPGPVITVSTACSSGAVAIKVAMAMLRTGRMTRILAGGADSLCRLTYYGFGALQLIDPQGARPLDQDRQGMSVAEGAAMLLLTTDGAEDALAEILGAGWSCDAYHPAAPDPQGTGALAAMQRAIEDAGISVSQVDYVNLHGTGTVDNDLSEARAVNRLFRDKKPLVSSVKGAFGHSLGASGAIEAVVSAICISEHLVAANTGCRHPDPALELNPVAEPLKASISMVLSNSFGFGGNNASLLIGTANTFTPSVAKVGDGAMRVKGSACFTGAGDAQATLLFLSRGKSCKGRLSDGEICKGLSPAETRRLKRLPRMALSLALAAYEDSGSKVVPLSVFLGTGWGALSETDSFLDRLFQSGERLSSPTDFVGSVHNAPACQVAIRFKATGANITTTGGDYSFEQAVMVAGLTAVDETGPVLVMGVDEGHGELSALFDLSVLPGDVLSDGGGALCLIRGGNNSGFGMDCIFFQNTKNNPDIIPSLIDGLGGPESVNERYGALLAGIPGGFREKGEEQLRSFMTLSGFTNPVIDYRRFTGEFAAASAVAAVMAVRLAQKGVIPGPLFGGKDFDLQGRGVLILGLGEFITAVGVAQ
jgi:3-oxoacyl-(acyl-carrier-protein) synthase